MTIDEQIEVMQHFRDGGEVEWRDCENRSSVWVETKRPTWNFGVLEYRKKEELKDE